MVTVTRASRDSKVTGKQFTGLNGVIFDIYNMTGGDIKITRINGEMYHYMIIPKDLIEVVSEFMLYGDKK